MNKPSEQAQKNVMAFFYRTTFQRMSLEKKVEILRDAGFDVSRFEPMLAAERAKKEEEEAKKAEESA